jgi:hypothetical protein
MCAQCIVAAGISPNLTRLDANTVQSMTTSQLKAHLNRPSDVLLLLTPTYHRRLEDSEIPTQLAPSLIVSDFNKYLAPAFSLSFLPSSSPIAGSLVIEVKGQDTVSIPPVSVPLDPTELKSPAKVLFAKFATIFPFEHSNPAFSQASQPVPETSPISTLLSKAASAPLIFECTISDSGLNKMRRRSLLVQEVLSTEISYLSDISTVITYWEPSVRNLQTLTPDEMTMVFRDFGSIQSCHSRFRSQLETLGTDYSAILGPVFLEFADFFKVSSNFISTYEQVNACLNKHLKNRKFADALQALDEANPDTAAKDLLSYLITPVQRMPRYTLFLRDIAKYTPECHPDFLILKAAAGKIEAVTRQLDAATRKAKAMGQVMSIEARTKNVVPLIDPSRALVDEFAVLEREKPGKLYLFTDSVLLNGLERRAERMIAFCPRAGFAYFPGAQGLNCAMAPAGAEVAEAHTLSFEDPAAFSRFVSLMEQTDRTPEPPSAVWTNLLVKTALPAVVSPRGATIGSAVFFFGGEAGGAPSAAFVSIDMESLNVTALPNGIEPRVGHTLTAVGETLYVIGGQNAGGIVREVGRFANGAWAAVASPGQTAARAFHSASAVGNQIVVFGGLRDQKEIAELVVFDTAAGTWAEREIPVNGPCARAGHSSAVLDGKLYIFGGQKNGTVLGALFAYDVAQDHWQAVATVGIHVPGRFGHCLHEIGGTLVLLGGASGDEKPKGIGIEMPNAASVLLNESGNVPIALVNFGSAVHGNRIVLFGGTGPEVAAASKHKPIGSTELISNSVFLVSVTPRRRAVIQVATEKLPAREASVLEGSVVSVRQLTVMSVVFLVLLFFYLRSSA